MDSTETVPMQETPTTQALPQDTAVAEAPAPETVTAGETPETPEAAIVRLQEALKKAEAATSEQRDAWLRAMAESDNIRKRAQAEVASAQKFAVESFATELLAVKDSLETSLNVENVTTEQLREGVELTLKLLGQAFDRFAVREVVPTAGEKFDPHAHQAMTLVESDAAPNSVVHVMQKGYKLNDRVIRPALVTVSKVRQG